MVRDAKLACGLILLFTCTGCGSGCIGCTEPPFPDYGNRGIYKHLVASNDELQTLHPEIASTVVKLKNGGVING